MALIHSYIHTSYLRYAIHPYIYTSILHTSALPSYIGSAVSPKPLPQLRITFPRLLCGIRIVLNEPRQKLCAIDLVCEHGLRQKWKMKRFHRSGTSDSLGASTPNKAKYTLSVVHLSIASTNKSESNLS